MINDEIRDKEVRLVGPEGEQLGIVSSARALELADEKNLDLVKIAPQAKPPVCKIMDYGKHKFELAKREKENRKNQKVVAVKEVRLSSNIDEHDFNTKVKGINQMSHQQPSFPYGVSENKENDGYFAKTSRM